MIHLDNVTCPICGGHDFGLMEVAINVTGLTVEVCCSPKCKAVIRFEIKNISRPNPKLLEVAQDIINKQVMADTDGRDTKR